MKVKECRTCIHRREGMLAVDPYECRRYPPAVVTWDHTRNQTVWPKVKPNDWCGEWKEDKS
jgi:hypothetical protein